MSSPHRARAETVAALAHELRRLGGQSVSLSHVVANRLGMNPTDLECLDVLAMHGPISAGRLAAAMGLTTGAITGVVDRLERAGLARRESDPTDRRRIIIRPHRERGEAVIGPHFTSLQQALHRLCGRYDEAELAIIVDFLNRLNALLIEETERLRAGTRQACTASRA